MAYAPGRSGAIGHGPGLRRGGRAVREGAGRYRTSESSRMKASETTEMMVSITDQVLIV